MSIALVTDSSCQLSPEEIEQCNAIVVPITIVIDDVEYADGVDITAATFYERIGDGVRLSTSQPSPGAFLSAWQHAAAAGATEIVSIHVGQEHSGSTRPGSRRPASMCRSLSSILERRPMDWASWFARSRPGWH